jgi:hypothetical protein
VKGRSLESANSFEECDLLEFLKLTSDEEIRAAAWPYTQWSKAGGSTTVLYGATVLSHDTPPEIIKAPTLIGLLSLASDGRFERIKQPPEQRAKNLEAHRQTVQAHKWLVRNDSFKMAKARFEKERVAVMTGPLASEFADFRFMHLIACHIGYFRIGVDLVPRSIHANSKQLLQAKGHAARLRALLSRGVRLSDQQQQGLLLGLLQQLEAEIENAPRKEKTYATIAKRQCVERLGIAILSSLGCLPSAMLLDITGMIEWTVDSRTIDRLVEKIRNKRQQELIKALLKHPH